MHDEAPAGRSVIASPARLASCGLLSTVLSEGSSNSSWSAATPWFPKHVDGVWQLPPVPPLPATGCRPNHLRSLASDNTVAARKVSHVDVASGSVHRSIRRVLRGART